MCSNPQTTVHWAAPLQGKPGGQWQHPQPGIRTAGPEGEAQWNPPANVAGGTPSEDMALLPLVCPRAARTSLYYSEGFPYGQGQAPPLSHRHRCPWSHVPRFPMETPSPMFREGTTSGTLAQALPSSPGANSSRWLLK